MLPVNLVDECIDELVGPSTVTLQQLVVAAFLVVDDAGQQVFGEVTLFQLVDFCKHQTSYLFKTLSLLGRSHQEETTVVVHQFATTVSPLHFHGLIEVEVEESCPSVAQHIFQQLQGVRLQRICLLGTPSHPHLFGFLSNDRCILGGI